MYERPSGKWRRSPTPLILFGLLLVFFLLVFALSRNEPPPTADDAQIFARIVA